MDQPLVGLFESRAGVVRSLDLQDVNPVFDLSPDGKWIAFVRTSTDEDGGPRERLYISTIDGKAEKFVSESAAHPAFLGKDTLAFSHYSRGRQALAIWDLKKASPLAGKRRPTAWSASTRSPVPRAGCY